MNTAEVHSNGINVYITNKVIAGRGFLIFFGCLNLIPLSFLILLISVLDDAAKLFIPIVLMFFLIVVLPWRSWLWNAYGKEYLIINTKTISYRYDYGIVITKEKTLFHHDLIISPMAVKNEEGVGHYRLYFTSHDEETKQPRQIFQTAILIPEADAKKILDEVSQLFEAERILGSFSAN